MNIIIKLSSALLCTALLSLSANEVDKKQEVKIDPEYGLIVAPGMQDIINNCTACHSTKFIINQRGSRETWKDMIVWMQETQGLWEFDAQTEKSILDYLETNYCPDARIHRRNNLDKSLLPKNPYEKI
jgi:hypothetical protein